MRQIVELEQVRDLLRSWGFTVHELADWRTSGVEPDDEGFRVAIVHDTGSGKRTGSSLDYIATGARYAPLSSWHLNRSGAFALVTAGKSNDAGSGSWAPADADENDDSLSLEIENCGSCDPLEPFTTTYEPAVAWGAAVRVVLGLPLIGHKEWAPGRKADPHFDMDEYRRDVDAFVAAKHGSAGAAPEGETMIVPVYSPQSKARPNPKAGNRLPRFTHSTKGIIGVNGAAVANDAPVFGWSGDRQDVGFRYLDLSDVVEERTIVGVLWTDSRKRVEGAAGFEGYSHLIVVCNDGADYGPYLST